MAKRAKQASFVALNVRLPPDLHTRLREAAGATRSLNSEILDRLQKSFEGDKQQSLWAKLIAAVERRADEDVRQLAGRIDRLQAELNETRSPSRRKKLPRVQKDPEHD